MSLSDEEKKRYVDEASFKLIGNLRTIRASIDREIENIRATLWVPREYEALPDADGNSFTGDSFIDGMVQPRSRAAFVFGVEFQIPGTEKFGLPETRQLASGFERIFFIEELRINDEDAQYFTINTLLLGRNMAFGSFANDERGAVHASKFATSSAPVLINHYGDVGTNAQIIVTNNSDEPRQFRAVLRGREQPEV